MSLPLLAVVFLSFLVTAYLSYGRWVARRLELDDAIETPAKRVNDGVDFVPTRPFYLFGQHFSAIAAAGPIAGPILASQTFGWLPCLLWIAFGVVFVGAVHDFTSLFASVRHDARSIAEITREHLGRGAGLALMAFIWIALMYVIVAFADITAASFVRGTDELRAAAGEFDPGGAVAASSVFYLALALVLGLVQKLLRPPLWLVSAIFVPAVFAMAWLGTETSTWLLLDRQSWGLLILVYCAIASVTPAWLLLQPRGYLGGFVLYAALALGVIGIFFGGYEIQQPAFRTWDAGGMTGSLFPFLFVTIACGACSGFHGLVCSGTTSKQVECESHTRVVGYGAMLAEAFVALIALVSVMIVLPSEVAGQVPGTIYGAAIGRFLSQLIGAENLDFAVTFGAMVFSTFVFDTLDVCTRLGRYLLQELFGWRGRGGAVGATLLTIGVPALLLSQATEGMWMKFWTLFGASNQLLAGLTLLAVTAWRRRLGRGTAFTFFPMVFVLTLTLWALGRLAVANGRLFAAEGSGIALVNCLASSAMIALAVYLVATGAVILRRMPELPAPQPAIR